MDGDVLFGLVRFVLAIVLVVALVGFVAFARGSERGVRGDNAGDSKRGGDGRD